MIERPNTPPEAFPGAFFEYDEGSPTGTMILHYHGHISEQDLELFGLLPKRAVITHTTSIEGEPITRVEFTAPNPDYIDENNPPYLKLSNNLFISLFLLSSSKFLFFNTP